MLIFVIPYFIYLYIRRAWMLMIRRWTSWDEVMFWAPLTSKKIKKLPKRTLTGEAEKREIDKRLSRGNYHKK